MFRPLIASAGGAAPFDARSRLGAIQKLTGKAPGRCVGTTDDSAAFGHKQTAVADRFEAAYPTSSPRTWGAPMMAAREFHATIENPS